MVSQIFQRSNEIIVRISTLASKMGQFKKIKALYHIKWYTITNLHDNVPFNLSYLTHFSSGSGRNFAAFLENLRHHNFVPRLSDL